MALSLAEASAQVQAYVDFLHQYNRLSARSLKRLEDRRVLLALAQTVQEGKRPRLAGYELFYPPCVRRIRRSRAGIDRRLRPARALRAFVGHRFTAGVTNNLRHNLQLLCRPCGISLWYSDSDMPNGSIFETIVQRIRQSDFCVFDDRETEVRPNVLIELGVAIGIGKPYFYLNYEKKRKVTIARRKEVITTASDLAGMLYMPYTSYQDVCLELARRLPGFLVDRKLLIET